MQLTNNFRANEKAQESLLKKNPSEQKTVKHWEPAENALAKGIMYGISPVGRNVAGTFKLTASFSSFSNPLAVTACLNQLLDETDQVHHVFTQKEVKNKLETQGMMNLNFQQQQQQPKPQASVVHQSTPLFDNRMIL